MLNFCFYLYHVGDLIEKKFIQEFESELKIMSHFGYTNNNFVDNYTRHCNWSEDMIDLSFFFLNRYPKFGSRNIIIFFYLKKLLRFRGQYSSTALGVTEKYLT